MGNLILPPIESIASLIDSLMADVPFYGPFDITIATNADGTGEWGWQTGDNSFGGQCYFYRHWAIGQVDNETDPSDLAKDLRGQLEDLISR